MITPGTMTHERLLETLKQNIRTVKIEDRGDRNKREADELRAKASARRMNDQRTSPPA